ncbi:MAG: hypothetical protein A2163_09960 [Actinobacteria bacterium RBG_13_35_12]|nr:MAG: hypothetical protein A2163_09960 [Actinobacteria bacterium RBG_13_35_12]OGD32255.1 MAG: hypothetical protein A2V94_09985 [Candidatus Atribacteria bacterium RBG_16_35_8]
MNIYSKIFLVGGGFIRPELFGNFSGGFDKSNPYSTIFITGRHKVCPYFSLSYFLNQLTGN